MEVDCNLDSNRIIANSLQEFLQLTDCNNINFDFNHYTIIGIKGLLQGHYIPKIDFRISQNILDKIINVEVFLSGGKSCSCKVMKPFYKRLIYMDKIEEGYSYKFKYINIEN